MMDYNSSRPKLIFSEYGRNIQNMVGYIKTIKEKEQRTNFAHAIVELMSQFYPQMKDITDFRHKLWDHLFIMADYDLDVEAPFPKPDKEEGKKTPEKVSYPSQKIKSRHYGKSIERMIDEVVKMKDKEKQDAYALAIANFMKMAYANWNQGSVSDEIILNDLKKFSDGVLDLKPEGGLSHVSTKKPQRKQHQNRGHSKNNQRKRKQHRR